jgi:membrane-associated phospholipid phosphatase
VLLFALRGGATRELRAWATYVATFVAFAVLRRSADEWGPVAATDYPIAADRLLGAGEVPTLWLQRAAYASGAPAWYDWAAVAVHLSYYAVPLLVALLLALRARGWLARYLHALSACYALGLVGHVLLPTVPPWMAAQTGALPHVHRIVHELWDGVSPQLYAYGYSVAGVNDVAAMPSLHTAAAATVALVGWQIGGHWRWLGAAYLGAMMLALAYLGEHYVVDELAGALLAAACWWAVARGRPRAIG